MKIKICGMRELQNISEVLKTQPDYLGFIFYDKSSRYVTESQMDEIMKLNFGETKPVGVFVNETFERVMYYADKGYFDTVQLHGDESVEMVEVLKNEGLDVIKVFAVADDFDGRILRDYAVADYFLFDTKGKLRGGNGKTFSWEVLQRIEIDKPFFLSGGLGVEELQAVRDFESDKMYALDFNSKLELQPALKDINKVRQVCQLTQKL